jgi:hypothetical protein
LRLFLRVPAGGFSSVRPVPGTQTAPSIKSKAEDVLLDVVVRDKKGHQVTNLKPEDFLVLDNGVPKF